MTGLAEEIVRQFEEQQALIRELVAALTQVEDRARMPRGVKTRSKWVIIPMGVYSRVYEALTKAKAAGFAP